MMNEKWELDEDLRSEIEEFLDDRLEIYPLPERLLFEHLMGVR